MLDKPLTDDERFQRMRDAGVNIVRESSKSLGLDIDNLARRAGCESNEISSQFNKGDQVTLSGKDWERLITFCALPERWVYRANVDVPKNFKLFSGAGAVNGSPEAAAITKIQEILPTTAWFYQEATRRLVGSWA